MSYCNVVLWGGDNLNPLVSVIDDNESVGWAVATVIRSAGFRVLVFSSAGEFIRSGQMDCTACLVVNAQLTGMSGLQLQSHLAAAGRHIPMVFTSSPADEKARALAVELGAVDILKKPSGDNALLKEVWSILKT
jgi:FixJ family two-component response regulator